MEPKYYGPYEIIRQNKSGNYILKDPEGNELEQSFPRWKLNPLTNFKDIKAITNKQCDSDSSESDSESTSDDCNTEETNKMATELIKSKETNDQPHKSEEKKKSNIKIINNRIVYKFEESIEKHKDAEIIMEQKIGNSFRYKIKQPDGNTKWTSPLYLDHKIIHKFNAQKNSNHTPSQIKNVKFNLNLTTITVIFLLFF